MADPTGIRGVIDSLEPACAILALDDGQRLDWPRDCLPPNARPGAAIVLRLSESDSDDITGKWARRVRVRPTGSGLIVEWEQQKLYWPASSRPPLGAETALVIHLDSADTERRCRQVQNRIDDLFGKP